MKKLLLLNIFLIGSIQLFAQTNKIQSPKLSASAKMFLWKQKNQNTTSSVYPENVYRLDANQNVFISTMIEVQHGFNESLVTSLDASIGTKTGNIWTVQVPINKMNEFTHLIGINYIDMDQPLALTLDSARKSTRVDSVQNGYGLPQAFSGKGVVVGIIDAGFDYTHPTFYDTSYSAYRVKKVWEQKNNAGTPPAGFAFGSEFADSLSIVTKGTDLATETHGTHVTGIAAGSGSGGPLGDNKLYRGMAYASDLVFVPIFPSLASWLNSGSTDIVDGMNYIYNYADAVGKPAVVNLSWGGPLGPRDGSSLFSQACNQLTGEGKIFTVSAGNDGDTKMHFRKTFSSTDTAVSTILTFPSGLPYRKSWVDVWGDAGKSFSIKFSLYQSINLVNSTSVITLDNSVHDLFVIGSNGDTCFIKLSSVTSELNQKPHMLLDLYSKVPDKLCITLIANDGKVDMWQGYILDTHGYYGTFTKNILSWATNGDYDITISDWVSTESAIGVAAYNSKTSFTNASGSTLSYSGYVKDDLALFSSHGPTADGRTKPDITGPGLALASAVSSVDAEYNTGGPSFSDVVSQYVSPLNGQTYSYAMAAGTSMSSPSVAGIVALLLEANDTLNPSDIMSIFAETAIKDSFTGTIITPGSSLWGYGKVNAYRAVKKALTFTGIQHQHESLLNCLVFPNPNNGNYSIEYISDRNEILNVSLYDLTGRKMFNELWNVKPGSNLYNFSLDKIQSGIYITTTKGEKGSISVRIFKTE